MNTLTDIEIAQKNKMKPIAAVAKELSLTEEDIESYGSYKAKISLKKLQELQATPLEKRGKLILVTAVTPTPAGEGKSTVTVGLGDGLRKIGKKSIIALREPSLGPCFGVKGGACGGGYSQIVPMEDINLHFTGDIHAISIANNLIAALIDNHLQQGNELGIDPKTVTWKRCVDLNDRVLRNVIVGLGERGDGVTREDHFSIAVASEIMAIVCLSKTIKELKEKINAIVIAKNYAKQFVTLGALGVSGAIVALLKDVIKPNLVQTLEETPAFVHGGPFANIAHGCNSVNATLSALALGDYVVTEAGFAADLGAEKFMDIKCRSAGLEPSTVVIVATIRALKMHGGVKKDDLSKENIEAVKKGFENLQTHIENISKFGVPAIIALNKFILDTELEIKAVTELCKNQGVECVLSEGWEKGGEGTSLLAKTVVSTIEAKKSHFKPIYELSESFIAKIEKLATNIYRAKSVEFSPLALRKLKEYTEAGYENLPICVAKTQNSISHDKALLGAPKDYVFPVRDVQLYSGAGFVVVLAGDIMTMPGLPRVPAACSIDVDDEGNISGLF